MPRRHRIEDDTAFHRRFAPGEGRVAGVFDTPRDFRSPGPDTHRFVVSVLCVETPQGWRIGALFTTAQKPR